MKKDLAIVVSSYDEACNMWNNFFRVFNYYWCDCEYNCYLINNFLRPQFHNFKVINTYEEKGWKNRILLGLKEIEEEYILFFFEDYFIGRKVEKENFEKILTNIKLNQIKMYQLSNITKRKYLKDKNESIYNINAKDRYAINLQCSIWEKKEFIKLIEKMEGVTPWDFERFYLKKSFFEEDKILNGYVVDVRDVLKIKHALFHGEWERETLNYYRKQNIKIETLGKKKMTILATIIKKCKSFIGSNLDNTTVYFLKKLLNILKVKTVSKF